MECEGETNLERKHMELVDIFRGKGHHGPFRCKTGMNGADISLWGWSECVRLGLTWDDNVCRRKLDS